MSKFLDFLSSPISLSPSPSKNSTLTSQINNPAAWLLGAFGGSKTLSGQRINGNSALTLDSWYAALRNISEDIAKLPLNVKERTPRGKILTTDHFAWSMLHEYANPCMSAMDLFQTDIQWAIGHGNGFAEIVRNDRGQAVEMWPIHPSRMTPFYGEDQKLFWRVRGRTSNIQGKLDVFIDLSDEDVFNLRGMGDNGIIGHSVITLASDSIGQGLAAQKSASSYYNNATDLSGVLVAPGSLSDKQYANMRETWGDRHEGGSENKHRMAILEGGLKFESMSSNAAEAQLLEAQGFTVERMARTLRIPPHKLMHNAGISKGNLEAENINYFSDTLTPWIKRISLEINRKIIRDKKFTAKHEVNALTLGDTKTRTAAFKTMSNHAVITPNQWMGFEGLNTIDEPWADQHYMQQNITTAERIEAGENIKAKPPGQMSGEIGEQGKPNSTAFDDVKMAHMPNFIHAAKLVVSKDSKMLKNKLSSLRADRAGFVKWAEHFYEKQEAYMIDVFGPCCKVLADSFKIMGAEVLTDDLELYARSTALNGFKKAMTIFDKQTKDETHIADVDEESNLMAQDVLNLMKITSQGADDDTTE